jgi:short subunit dehydrogenase-like uncharacterized protein
MPPDERFAGHRRRDCSDIRRGSRSGVLAARKADALQQLAAELGPAAHPFAAHTGKEAGCVALVLVVDGGTTMT